MFLVPPSSPSFCSSGHSGSPHSPCIVNLLNPLFGEHGIVNFTGLFFSLVDLGLSIRGLAGLGTSSLIQTNFRLVCDVWSVSVVDPSITYAVFVVVMVVVFTVVIGACMVSNVYGVAMTHFSHPFVQANTASSMCWVEESGHVASGTLLTMSDTMFLI